MEKQKKQESLYSKGSMEKDKVFLDSSILIAALLSSQGGSFYILDQLFSIYELQINEYVLEETMRVLATKFHEKPELKTTLFLMIGIARIQILPNPSLKQIKNLEKVLNPEDAPILASAWEHSAYLISLDKDFFAHKVVEFIKNKNLLILKPREFIALLK